MPYDLTSRLVIGLASSALFDLAESDKVFRTEGEDAYRLYQRENQNIPLKPGVAFAFIRRLLSLNELSPNDPLVEVILLSRNDPDTGMRVMDSIKKHKLDISRALFLQGGAPQRYIAPLSIALFLSANQADVRQAILAGHPAGQVLTGAVSGDTDSGELRIAFDFDGVIADDAAEVVYHARGQLDEFHQHEQTLIDVPHSPGPLATFLKKLSVIQKFEQERLSKDPQYKQKLKISIVTARNAPSHERVVNTMRAWGISINEAFFLGGVEKRLVLEVLQPHIFFDDQLLHLDAAAGTLPCVHIPFGVRNR
ncbi:5'-nucleotidase family protein [Burkholderia multivorans]|uniref:5'-nucleotidase family protein n=1 Tax=Burkholderia multivorans TaxID=87883 RepID=A0ABD7L985_9BURK|nr:5'-nucleotidase [Burkholderia multivorans]MBU9290532.1 5'-nucleotidase [Burkholderia multivorans]SAJ95459.1 5'-nucleotidase family protein [Burkholderia multivorans]SAK00013.1 5'-nucleotidase family protein [Burkholderia multivorans]HEF5151419.1 5'-nucleotidase [Burkholderia multivorans]